MKRINPTSLSNKEFADRLISSFAKAAVETDSEFTAFYYARECVRIAREFLNEVGL